MTRYLGSWGIEVGANAIKAIRLMRHGTGVVVTDYTVIPFKKVLSTPDLKVDEAIQASLDKFLAKYDVQKDIVMVSVPGNVAFAKFAKLPPVEPKKIPDIVQFEAVQQIPFPIEQVEWDYQVFSQADSPDVELGIFAITKERVLRVLSNYQAVGLQVDGLTLSALAVYNAMAYDLQLGNDSSGMMLLDIGTTCTDVIIVEGGNLWLRTFQIGGNNFTEALIRSFKLSFNKAEKLKREAGTSKYTRQIFQAMRPVFADLVQELQKTLGFYMSMNRDAHVNRLIGMGSTFRLPGLQKFLKQQLQMEVVRLDGFKRVSAEGKQAADFVDRSLNLVTAYGLALQGLGLETVSANILPSHILKKRLWKAKQPWVAAAAAVMVAATVGAGARLAVTRTHYEAELQESDPKIESVISQAEAYKEKWDQVEGRSDPRPQIENLRRLLDYREVWPLLLSDISQAIAAINPQPPLLDTDYTAIKAIPRDQRRRIYIESISAAYQFSPPGSKTAPEADRAWGAQDTPPSFLITVKGTTPYRDATSLFRQGFIKWLQDHRERDDRPYRFMISDQALRNVKKITVSANEVSDRAGVSRPSTFSRGSMAGRPGMIHRGPEPTDSLNDALPTHPLADEPKTNDWQFEVTWTVQLIPPEKARQAEEASLAMPTPPTLHIPTTAHGPGDPIGPPTDPQNKEVPNSS